MDTNRVRGALFGAAIGDALGFGMEFQPKAKFASLFPNGLRSYDDIKHIAEDGIWRRGDWTDDTEQTLCVLDSLLAHRSVNVQDIAARFKRWAASNGFGLGATVRAVLREPDFLADPHAAARRVWEASGRTGAANGAVMRTAVLGIWNHESEAEVIRAAEYVCKVTHADPRCIGSCVAVTLAVRRLVNGEAVRPIDFAQAVSAYHHDIDIWLWRAEREPLEALQLDDEPTIGFTLKAMAAGFWAMHHAASFEDGLGQVIAEGGDADTNGTVAGALLGAKFGFSSISSRLVDGLTGRARLESCLGMMAD